MSELHCGDCQMNEKYIVRLKKERDALRAELADFKEVLESKQEDTHKLDIALNGEAGAAKQASLCDLIGPARQLRAALDKSLGALQECRKFIAPRADESWAWIDQVIDEVATVKK